MENETYSIVGPECPHCGHVQNASDEPSIYYDEDLHEVECGECEKTYSCSLYVKHSWTSKPLSSEAHMTRPTLGPWIAAPDPEQDDCMAVVTADKHTTVAFVEPSIEDEEIANARLLAAAPELLAALEDLSFACFAGIGLRVPDLDVYNRTFGVLDRVRQQIGIATAKELLESEEPW